MSTRHVILIVALASLAGASAAGLEAGAAKVEIKPPLGAPLNGYGDRMGRGAVATHDPLWSRALYLDDGETRLFLVNADLCVIHPALRQRVLELAPREVPQEHIILTATHTHSGPGGMIEEFPFRIVSGRFMPEVLEETAGSIAQSMREALMSRRRAAIGYGAVRQDVLSSNRRVSGGPIDTQVGVVSVEDADGNHIAVLTNFAAHPTSVPKQDHYSFSADYCGFYYSELERLTAEGCVAMFLNGASGNQTIGNPEGKSGWERTASVGRLLAIRAKEAVNKITCGDAKLRVTWSEPTLPPSVAPFLPRTTLLQTLEINDLLMAFIPGEMCVEIGLELRQQALERGYKSQFTVTLSNDHLLYFVPRAYYPHLYYETCMNFFGPAISQWFYREMSALLNRGTPDPGRRSVEAALPEEIGGALYVELAGTPFEMGMQRGLAFSQDMQARYEERVVGPVRTGELLPDSGMWPWWPPFMDPAPLALPVLAMGTRPLLDGIADSVFDELEGMAEGAGLPFDALWMLHNASHIAAREDRSTFFSAPLCTMFAVSGDRAGADELLVGRNLDWAEPELPVVVMARPKNGHAFLQAGFTWNTGVFTGINDAGLVLCAERAEHLGRPEPAGVPLEFLLRALLEEADTLEAAVARLKAAAHLRGYHVLAAAPAEDGAQAAQRRGQRPGPWLRHRPGCLADSHRGGLVDHARHRAHGPICARGAELPRLCRRPPRAQGPLCRIPRLGTAPGTPSLSRAPRGNAQ